MASSTTKGCPSSEQVHNDASTMSTAEESAFLKCTDVSQPSQQTISDDEGGDHNNCCEFRVVTHTSSQRKPYHKNPLPEIVTPLPCPSEELQPSKSGRSRRTYKLTQQEKEACATKWRIIFNESVFKNRLPQEVRIVWSARLTRTAGIARVDTVRYASGETETSYSIQLASKVLDNDDRIAKTLLHELCHIAQYSIESEFKPEHGPGFQKWAQIATAAFPQYEVTVTHNYDIFTPFRYQCLKCSRQLGRHSRAKNLSTLKCKERGCEGTMEFVGHFDPDGTKKETKKKPSEYNIFVKKNFNVIKSQCKDTSHKAVMAKVSEEWQKLKCASKAVDDEEVDSVRNQLQRMTLK